MPLRIREVSAEHKAVCGFERFMESSAERPSGSSANAQIFKHEGTIPVKRPGQSSERTG
jgi:hypothetical protein